MSRKLAPHRRSENLLELVVAPIRAHDVTKREFIVGEEAVADRAIGHETQTVARAAEGLGHRVDKADLADAVGEGEAGRGGMVVATTVEGDELVSLLEHRKHVGTSD